jgi:hypothetical protein
MAAQELSRWGLGGDRIVAARDRGRNGILLQSRVLTKFVGRDSTSELNLAETPFCVHLELLDGPAASVSALA